MPYVPLSSTSTTAPVATGKGYIPLSSGGKSSGPTVTPPPVQASGYQPISKVGLIKPQATMPGPGSTTPIATGPIPANALKGSLGGGYGASSIADTYSGKPLLTYENTTAKSSQLLSDRVAPTFNPTVPTKIDPSVLHNGRMPESASQAVRQATGAEPDEQLDHLISLELGGSNETSNLNLEKENSNGVQPSLTLENQTAKDVASGKISYIDGQKIIARAKGVQLPDDPDYNSSPHPLASGYPKPNTPAGPITPTTPSGPISLPFTTPGNAGTTTAKATNPEAGTTPGIAPALQTVIANFAPFNQIARMAGGESFLESLQNVMKGQSLNAADLDKATARVKQLVSQGVPQATAAKQALTEATQEKMKTAITASVNPEADTTNVAKVIENIAKSTNPTEIASLLKNVPGVAEEDVPTLSKALKNVSDPTAVQSVIDSVKEFGVTEAPPKPASPELTYDTSDIPRQHGDPIKFAPNDTKAVEPAYQLPGTKTAAEPAKDPNAYAKELMSQQGKVGSSKMLDKYNFEQTTVPESSIKTGKISGGESASTKYWTEQIKNGDRTPIVAVTDETGHVDVIDGMHKLQAYRANGITDIPTLIGKEGNSNEALGRAATQSAIDRNAADQLKIREQNALTEKVNSEKPLQPDSFMQKLKNILNPLKTQDADVQKAFKDYTRKISVGHQLANDEARKFTDISAEEGLDTIKRYERGSATPATEKLQNHFENLYDEARNRGLDVPHRENYLPHTYAESHEEIAQTMRNYLTKKGVPAEQIEEFMNGGDIPQSTAKRLGLNPSFAATRTFPTYQDAIDAGLHPKYTHPAQLAGHYRDAMERALAGRDLVTDLVGKGKLVTAEDAPAGYKAVNLEFSPKGYYAKPRLAQMLNGLFNDPAERTFWQHVTGFTGALSRGVQKMELTTGVPGTNINVHSIGQLIKEITAGNFNKIPTFLRATSDSASIKYFEDNRDVLQRMAENNLDVGKTIADYSNLYKNMMKPGVSDKYATGGVKSAAGFLAKETGETFERVFTKKNFTSFMPQLYVSTFKSAAEHFVSQGLPQEEADALATDVVKAFHGLTGNVGRARGTEDGLSTAFFAPQFRASIIDTLWNSVRSVTTDIANPAFYQNRRLLGGMALTFGMYTGANKYLNGHYMWQNPSTHQFDLQIPTGNGNYAYVPFMPTFMAVPRNLIGGGLSVAQSDLKGATQQFSSVLAAPVQLFGQLYANKDFYGRPIYADTDPGPVKAEKIASYLGLNVVPPFVKEAVTYIENKGTTPLYQSITTGMELPIKYGTDAKNNTSAYYDAATNLQNLHAQATAAFKPTFDKIQSLVTSGQNDQAQQLVNNLSDSDYALYKDLKSSATSQGTIKGEQQFLPTYQQIKSLIQSGKSDQAQSMVNGLSDSDYKLYQKLKAKGM